MLNGSDKDGLPDVVKILGDLYLTLMNTDRVADRPRCWVLKRDGSITDMIPRGPGWLSDDEYANRVADVMGDNGLSVSVVVQCLGEKGDGGCLPFGLDDLAGGSKFLLMMYQASREKARWWVSTPVESAAGQDVFEWCECEPDPESKGLERISTLWTRVSVRTN